MPKIQDVISRVDEVKINAFSEAAKVNWINQVEGWIKDKVVQTFSYFEILRVRGQASYDLPSGVKFTDIVVGFTDGAQVQKIDARSLNRVGYFLGSDGKLNVFPIPTNNDIPGYPGLRFTYKIPHVPYKWPENQNTELLLPGPYDKVYEDYIFAMIDWSNGKLESYQNSMAMYNASWDEMIKWYKQSSPVPSSRITNLW